MPKTTEIEANGLRFTADVSGDATMEAAICLHGYPNSRYSWSQLHEVLGAHGICCVAPDQRGYSCGARPLDVPAYHVDHLVDDVIAIADAQGVGKFHLIGHDWGGQIAWLTASRHPDRLRSLAVLSRPHPAAFAYALEHDSEQAKRSRHHKIFQEEDMADRLLADDSKAIRNTLCFENAAGLFGSEGQAQALPRRMSDDKAREHLSVLNDRAAMDAVLNWYRAAYDGVSTLARADVPKIDVPTLYIWGREDMSVGEIAATATAEQVLADYQFEALAGAGHFLAEEMPEEVNALLLAHIQRNSAR
ncbi:MAG: pimeloyl-ACP methyl ester carboxylesterase [Gammaproteobacteria bacterium]